MISESKANFPTLGEIIVRFPPKVEVFKSVNDESMSSWMISRNENNIMVYAVLIEKSAQVKQEV